jgi:hypothetical protein
VNPRWKRALAGWTKANHGWTKAVAGWTFAVERWKPAEPGWKRVNERWKRPEPRWTFAKRGWKNAVERWTNAEAGWKPPVERWKPASAGWTAPSPPEIPRFAKICPAFGIKCKVNRLDTGDDQSAPHKYMRDILTNKLGSFQATLGIADTNTIIWTNQPPAAFRAY